jgi:hypothetical protein
MGTEDPGCDRRVEKGGTHTERSTTSKPYMKSCDSDR